MFKARYSPTPRQAAAIDKVWPDTNEFTNRERNAGDNVLMQKSYPLTDKGELAIMQGEICVAKRHQIHKRTQGRSQRKVISSTNGLYYGDSTTEGLMRQYDFAGVAIGSYEHGGDSLYGMDPMEHGFGVILAGTETINAPFHQDLHPSDLLAWRFKSPARTGDPRTQNMARPHSVDTGLNPKASLNRAGTPFPKALIELEVFEPSDFSFQLAGAYDLFTKGSSVGGIADLNVTHLLGNKKELSTLQEEALGWAYGLLTVVVRGNAAPLPGLSAAENLARATAARNLADEYGLTGDRITPAGWSALQAIFLRNVTPGQNEDAIRTLGGANYSDITLDNNAKRYEFLADNLFVILCGGVAGAWYEKARRIIGKSMGSFSPKDSPDVLLGLSKFGF